MHQSLDNDDPQPHPPSTPIQASPSTESLPSCAFSSAVETSAPGASPSPTPQLYKVQTESSILKEWLAAATLRPLYNESDLVVAPPHWKNSLRSYTPLPFWFLTAELRKMMEIMEQGVLGQVHGIFGSDLRMIPQLLKALDLICIEDSFSIFLTSDSSTAAQNIKIRICQQQVASNNHKFIIHLKDVPIPSAETIPAFQNAFKHIVNLAQECLVLVSGPEPLALLDSALPPGTSHLAVTFSLETQHVGEVLHFLIDKGSQIFQSDASLFVRVATTLRGSPLGLILFLQRVQTEAKAQRPIALRKMIYDVWEHMVAAHEENVADPCPLKQLYTLIEMYSDWSITDNMIFCPKSSNGYNRLKSLGHILNVTQVTCVFPTETGILVKYPYPWTRLLYEDNFEKALEENPGLENLSEIALIQGALFQGCLVSEVYNPERKLLEWLCNGTPYQPDKDRNPYIRGCAADDVNISELATRKSVVTARHRVNRAPFSDIVVHLILRPEFRATTKLPFYGILRLKATCNGNTTEVKDKAFKHYQKSKSQGVPGVSGALCDHNFLAQGSENLSEYLAPPSPPTENTTFSLTCVALCGYQLWEVCPSASLVNIPPPRTESVYYKPQTWPRTQANRVRIAPTPSKSVESLEKGNWIALLRSVENETERDEMAAFTELVISKMGIALQCVTSFTEETARSIFRHALIEGYTAEVQRLSAVPTVTALEDFILARIPRNPEGLRNLRLISTKNPDRVPVALRELASLFHIDIS
ncbi:hypothetical protein Pelo_8440 [Pelomyxa schiedti]|nr:hypothetical protein Pelo_8440 [Pelomyxa schiedti]